MYCGLILRDNMRVGSVRVCAHFSPLSVNKKVYHIGKLTNDDTRAGGRAYYWRGYPAGLVGGLVLVGALGINDGATTK
jgi:hypothetical protein